MKYYELAIRFFICLAIYIYLNIIYLLKIISLHYSNLGLIQCNIIILIFKYFFRTYKLRIIFIASSKDDLLVI